MQDSKIDVGDDLESDDAQQLQLPWSIKRVILWMVLYVMITAVVSGLFSLMIVHFDHVNGWDLTGHDMIHITQISLLPVAILAFLAFLFWQCKKVDLSIRTIWGTIYHVTQVQYIIFALVFSAIISLLEVGIIVNSSNSLPKYSSDVIFCCNIIFRCILGPLQEELYFRGILYRILRKRNDIVISTLISALIFSVCHVWGTDLTGLFFIFFSGVVTAFLVERTNSLTASFVYHAIGNLVPEIVFQYREFFF